jgi:putative transcriptional regulator
MANRLREFRKNQGMTQVQLAELVGCKQGLISLYERDERHPVIYGAIRLARALDTTVEELFGGEVDG